jgi:hypothetical protein
MGKKEELLAPHLFLSGLLPNSKALQRFKSPWKYFKRRIQLVYGMKAPLGGGKKEDYASLRSA